MIKQFKNAIIYLFTPPKDFDEDVLIAALEYQSFEPRKPSEGKSYGFDMAAPGISDSQVYSTFSDAYLIRLHIEEAILPSAAVKKAVQEKIERIEEREGRRVFRKERQQLTEETRISMLPRAISRDKYVPALVMPKDGLIVVATSSPSMADSLISHLRSGLGALKIGLKVELPSTKQAPSRSMSNWLVDPASAPHWFAIGSDVDLFDPLENQSKIRIKGQELGQSEIKAHVTGGMLVESLNLVWDRRFDFTLKSDLSIKRLSLTSDYMDYINNQAFESEDLEDSKAVFDADYEMFVLDLMSFVPDLFDSFGGKEG